MKDLMDSNMTDEEARSKHREGPIARKIEEQTAKIPSDAFLWAALGSMGLSLFFELTNRKQTANFISAWAPTLLTLGVYNKIVKTEGSDRSHDWNMASSR